MTKTIKLILGSLVVLLGTSIVVALLAFDQNKKLEINKNSLEAQLSEHKIKENKILHGRDELAKTLKSTEEEKKKIEQDFAGLKQQLENFNKKTSELSAQRDEWRKQVDDLKKERDDLVVKLSEKPPAPQIIPSAPSVSAPLPQATAINPDQVTDEFWADVLKEKATLQMELEKLTKEMSSHATELQDLKQKNAELQLELSQLSDAKKELEQKSKYSENLANSLSLELAREKNDKRSILNRMQSLKEESINLRSQVKEITSLKFTLEKGIAALRSDKDMLAKKLMDTENVLQAKMSEVTEIKNTIENSLKDNLTSLQQNSSEGPQPVDLPRIVVTPSGENFETPPSFPRDTESDTISALSGPDGRIVSINEENNFVIVDLGENAGIQLGAPLAVYRGSQYIAGLEVIQIRKDICAADIREAMARIEVGDTVR